MNDTLMLLFLFIILISFGLNHFQNILIMDLRQIINDHFKFYRHYIEDTNILLKYSMTCLKKQALKNEDYELAQKCKEVIDKLDKLDKLDILDKK